MSDFDKEAERERLREQYERDKQEREAAEQMSELLLQGATMTNAHCSECGDPIFRYDGQEFCPTCERPVSRSDNGQAQATAGDGEPTAPNGETDRPDGDDETIEVTTPSDDARVAFGGVDEPDSSTADTQTSTGVSPDARSDAEAGRSPTPDRGHEHEHDQSRDKDRRQTETEESAATRSRSQSQSSTPAVTAPETDTATATARESLTQALVRFSEQAAATDDPRRAQDALAAAREAAEALAALRY